MKKPSPPAPRTAIGYARVSTEEQANEGISLSAQEDRIRKYCYGHDLELVDFIVDAGVSAGKKLADRPGGRQILDATEQRKASAVVAYKLDRLFRNATDCMLVTDAWVANGVSMHFVDMGGQAVDTTSAMGRFFFNVMAAVADMERNLIKERTKLALSHKKQRGQRVGYVPLGKALRDDGVHLDVCDGEERAVRRARELRAAGASLTMIAETLAQEGFKPRGKQWHKTTIARIVRS